MDITKMCGFLKNSSRLILSTAHGGTSVGSAVYADVPPNVVIIEVGLATHSTWQSMSPKIITYFQNICNIGHHASPAGRAAAFNSHGQVLSEGDIKIIESSIRIYQGGDTMQVYNMTFSHEGDAAAFIREYPRGGAPGTGTGYNQFCEGGAVVNNAEANDKLTYLAHSGGVWYDYYLSYKMIIEVKSRITAHGAGKYVILTISCKPSVAQTMKRKPEEIIADLSHKYIDSDIDKLLNLLVHAKHMMNGQRLMEGVMGKQLTSGQDNQVYNLIALHELIPPDDPLIHYASTIIEQSAGLTSSDNIGDRIDVLLDSYVIDFNNAPTHSLTAEEVYKRFWLELEIFYNRWAEIRTTERLIWEWDAPLTLEEIKQKAVFIENFKKFYSEFVSEQKALVELKKQKLRNKFITVQRAIEVGESGTIHQAMPEYPGELLSIAFRRAKYGTKFSDVWTSLKGLNLLGAMEDISEIYKDRRDFDKDKFTKHIRTFIRNLSRRDDLYPCDKENGVLYKVLKDLMTQMQLCLCRFCGCGEGKQRCGSKCVLKDAKCPLTPGGGGGSRRKRMGNRSRSRRRNRRTRSRRRPKKKRKSKRKKRTRRRRTKRKTGRYKNNYN